MPDKSKVLDGIEYFLGLIAFVSLFIFIHLNMSIELQDPDIWLHIKTGEYIVAHQTVPHTDIFSSTVPGKEWIDHSWLVQVIFYLVFHYAGPDNLILLSSSVVLIAFLFLFFSFYKQRRNLTFGVAILAITILASRLRFNIRPENFSIMFFSIFLFLLTRCVRTKWVFLLPLIQLFWVNCHGFFIVGIVLVGLFLIAEKLKRIDALPWEWSKVDILDNASYKNLLLAFLLSCLALFLNPYGYKGVIYPFLVTFNSIGKLSIFYKYVLELLPTWQIDYKLISSYYILIAVSASLFLFNFRRINLAHLFAWLVFLGISLRVNRNIIFFNFIAFLTTTNNLIQGFIFKKTGLIKKPLSKLIYFIKFAILAIIIFWFSKNSNSILNSKHYIFEENRYKSSLFGIAAKEYPINAVNFVLNNELPGNIFNQFNYGSYLINRMYPKKRVFIDGRTELYGEEFFKNYQKIGNLDEDTINSLFAKYDINTVFVAGTVQEIGYFAAYFFHKPGWALVYFEGESLIFLRDTARNKKLIEELRIDLKKWQTQKADLDKLGMQRVFPEPYIRRGWMFYFLGLDEQAIGEVRQALRILPSAADAYNIIGRIYIKQKSYDQAFEALRLARIYDPGSKETLISLGDYYAETGKIDLAIESYKNLISSNPRYAEGYYLLGQLYYKTGDMKSAIKLMRMAIKITPFCAKYYRELRDLLDKNNDPKGVTQVYQEAVSLGLSGVPAN